MNDIRPARARVLLVAVVMLAVFGILLGRLVELTIIRGTEYRQRADENRLFVRPIRALRGVIMDRHATALVRNVPSARALDLPGDDMGPVEIEEAARYYPFGSAFAHVIGYIGEVSDEELSRCRAEEPCDVRQGDLVGKTGLERMYDGRLRGRDGSELVEVDANGTLLRVLGSEPAVNGKNIETVLERGLQEIALGALNGQKGAVVALDPLDGSVMALVSSPTFDPNIFQKSQQESAEIGSNQIADRPDKSDLSDISAVRFLADGGRDSDFSDIEQLLHDTENRPLFDRAIGGEYPPGSVFKLVVAAAGFSEGKLTGETKIDDTGEIKIGEFRYGNWYFDQYGRTEGTLQLPRAITRSNDIFFYKVGEWVGPETLARWAKALGLGEKTGIDTTGESDGLVPDPLWKERVIGERWFLGNTYHMAIGQGDVRVTPLQAATMTAAVVTGKRCTPYIAKDEGKAACEEIPLKKEHRDLILEGMVGACSRGGTAFPFFEWNESGSPGIVACKTGTAQHGGEKTKPHAWIVVTGPVTKAEGPDYAKASTGRQGQKEKGMYQLDVASEKRIVLTVLLEEAGEGSAEAGPVAKEILEKWFSR